MGLTEVLQVALPSGVGLVAAVVTPIALHAQQRQQIKRDLDVRRIEDARAAREAVAAALHEQWELKRKIYSATVRAIGHYRAEAAVAAAAVERTALDPMKSQANVYSAVGGSLEFPTRAFAQAQEALADARLAAGADGRESVNRLDVALQASVGAVVPSAIPCAEAWPLWVALREAVDAFVDECARELDRK